LTKIVSHWVTLIRWNIIFEAVRIVLVLVLRKVLFTALLAPPLPWATGPHIH